MRIDADGNELQQVTIWIPVKIHRLIRADRLNLTRFVIEMLEVIYGDPSSTSRDLRSRLAQAARESFAKHRAREAEREADREHVLAVVRQMREERDAAKARQDGIAEALLQIVGDNSMDRYRRLLPENDPHGDRIEDWDALVRRVSRLCGAEIDAAEVAAGLQAITAKRA